MIAQLARLFRRPSVVLPDLRPCDAVYVWGTGTVLPDEPCRLVRLAGERALVTFPGRHQEGLAELTAWVSASNVVSL